MLTEDGLYDDYEFFKEQLIECKSMLRCIIQNSQKIIDKCQNRSRIEQNLYYLKNIAISLNKIKDLSRKVVFSCNQNESSQSTDDIYVDLNNSINSSFYTQN